jgi:hypothetical protein
MAEQHDRWLAGLGIDVSSMLQTIGNAEMPSAGDLVDGAKGMARDKLLEGVGQVSGVVKQVTEVVDTGLWVGTEYKDARAGVVSLAGAEGSVGNQIASHAFDAVANVLTMGTANTLSGLGDAAERIKAAGLVDTPAALRATRACSRRWRRARSKVHWARRPRSRSPAPRRSR